LVVSHDLAAVAHLARRLVVLDAGRIVADGATDALLAASAPPPLARLLQAL
jgi:peptide/nickel transport system ATP-binding protein